MARLNDLTGRTFGLLTVTDRAGSNDRHEAMWGARCQCGAHTVVKGTLLTSGQTRSCGCLKRQRRIEAGSKPRKRERNQRNQNDPRWELRMAKVPEVAFDWARRSWRGKGAM